MTLGSEHKAPSISSGVSSAVANGLGGFVYKPHSKRYSNSSIFLENRDILNDSDNLALEIEGSCGSSGVDYRHSSILTQPNCDVLEHNQISKYPGKDLRRYSDTKLLASGETDDVLDSMLNEHQYGNKRTERQMTKQHSEADVIDAVIDIESLQRRSLGGKESAAASIADASGSATKKTAQQIERERLFFKSLPNLSSSCENLLKK